MSPPPPDSSDLQTIGAALAAVKPVYWLMIGTATITYVAAGVVSDWRMAEERTAQRLERVEQNVETIKLILCEDKPADSYCKGAPR